MKMTSRKLLYALITILSLLLAGWLINDAQFVQAQVERVQRALQSSLGNSFSYQGYLDDGGNPANGSYDFEFALFDAASGGNQIGSTQAETLIVSDGVFMVELNSGNEFGTNVFDGSDLYLELKIWDTGSSSFVTLTPRQALTAVPYAHFAKKVEPLDNVINVAKSGGDFTTITDALNAITDASDANPYIIRVAPGVYEETVDLKSHVDIEGSGEQTTIIRSIGGGSLSPTSGSSATMRASGNIVAEVRFLTVESDSTDNAVAIWTKSIPSASLKFTHVTAKATTSGHTSVGILNYESSPTLEHVTVSAHGAATLSYGLFNYRLSAPNVQNSTFSATSSNQSYGIENEDQSAPVLTNVTAIGFGGAYPYGVAVSDASATMTNVEIRAFDGSGDNIGLSTSNATVVVKNANIHASGGDTTKGLSSFDSIIKASDAIFSGTNGTDINQGIFTASTTELDLMNVQTSASGGTYSRGLNISSATTGNITNVIATALNGTYGYGILNHGSINLSNVTASATGATWNYGLYNNGSTGSQTVNIDGSQFSGSTNAVRNSPIFTTNIGASKLDGSANNVGTLVCIASYDSTYTALNSSCQ